MRAVGFSTPPTDPMQASERPLLAAQRFKRLLKSSPEELPLALVRIIRLLRGEADVAGIARALLDWGGPFGDRVRRDWAFDYYAAGEAKPVPSPALITQSVTEGVPS